MAKVIEVLRDTMYIGTKTDKGIYRMGTLSFVLESNGTTIYEFDIDPKRHAEALRLAGSFMLPSFDPDYGWKQRHVKEIQFIYDRTYHPRRPDLEELLKPWGLTPKTYTKWELLKRTRGEYRDKFRVTPDISETY